jgi:hypothetical protein
MQSLDVSMSRFFITKPDQRSQARMDSEETDIM